MFFSVIVPIYNGEAYLPCCLDSILKNTESNYELIIVDDGSQDCTGDIVDNYAARYKQIRCVHIDNCGVGNAREVGLEMACGEYIIFVDGDDAWDDSFNLLKLEEEIRESKADMYVFGFIIRRLSEHTFSDRRVKTQPATFDDWRDNQTQFLTYFPNGLMFLCWNKVFRRQCIIDHQIRSVHHHMEDFRFVLDFLSASKKTVFLPIEPYIHLKRGVESRSTSARQGMLEGYNICHRLFLSLFSDKYDVTIHKIMASTYIGAINRHLELLEKHIDEENSQKALLDIWENDLFNLSMQNYHGHTVSEKITYFLMRNGAFTLLMHYRKLVKAVKNIIH